METGRAERSPWVDWIVIAALVGIALVLRWRYVREISLFVDEFVTAWAARNVLSHGLPIFPSGNLYPHGPTFTYLVAPFLSGGFSEVLARLPGVIVGLAAIPVAYGMGRRLLSPAAGLAAAAALAVDPDAIVWGARARMYGLLQLLTILVVYFFYRGLAEDRRRDRYLAMGLLVAAILTHAEAIFLLPVLGLAALVAWPWRRLLRWSVVLPFALGAAGAGLYYLLARFGQGGHLETIEKTRPYLALDPASLLAGPQIFAPVFVSLHRLPFTVLALAGLYFALYPRPDRRSALVYLYVVLGAFVVLIVGLAGATWQNERYLFMVLPLLFLLGGEALARLGAALARPMPPGVRRLRAWGPPLLAGAVALFVGLTGAPAAYSQVWGYDLAFRALGDRLQPGDVVVSPMPTAAALYLGRLDYFAIQSGYEEFLVQRPGDSRPVDLWTATPVLTRTAEFVDLLASAPRVWLVADGWRLQTRYEPDFILAVADHMGLEYDERGVKILRAEGLSPTPPPAVERERRAEFEGQMALTGYALPAAGLQPGQPLDVTLHWQALAGAKPGYTAFLHLVAADGTGVAGVDEPVLRGLFQPDLWPKDESLPDQHRLLVPNDLPPGRYRLDLGLYPPGQPDSPLAVEGDSRVALAYLLVGGSAAPPSQPADATFGGQIRLLGYDWDGKKLTLHWQAVAPVDRDYTVFAHVVGPDGDIVVQDDERPGGDFFPTSAWLAGDTILSEHDLGSSVDWPPGRLRLVVGIYHAPSGDRLQAVDAGGRPLGDSIVLQSIDVETLPTGEGP